MAKSNTLVVKLVSTANTGFYYVTKKNPKTSTEKLEFRKYDPVVRKHVLFKEGRIKERQPSAGNNKAAPRVRTHKGGFFVSVSQVFPPGRRWARAQPAWDLATSSGAATPRD